MEEEATADTAQTETAGKTWKKERNEGDGEFGDGERVRATEGKGSGKGWRGRSSGGCRRKIRGGSYESPIWE